MRKRTGEWGRPVLDEKFAEAWHRFAAVVDGWVRTWFTHDGPEGASGRIWLECSPAAAAPRSATCSCCRSTAPLTGDGRHALRRRAVHRVGPVVASPAHRLVGSSRTSRSVEPAGGGSTYSGEARHRDRLGRGRVSPYPVAPYVLAQHFSSFDVNSAHVIPPARTRAPT